MSPSAAPSAQNKWSHILYAKDLNFALMDPYTPDSANHEYAHPCSYLDHHFLEEMKGLRKVFAPSGQVVI